MIKQLTEIRNELLVGVENSDLLYIKMQINKIDTLLYNASKNNVDLPVSNSASKNELILQLLRQVEAEKGGDIQEYENVMLCGKGKVTIIIKVE